MFCFLFFNFFPWPFCWSVFSFNFIIQPIFLFYVFQFNPYSFDLFFFLKVIFQFNLTFQLKIFICALINFFSPSIFLDPFVYFFKKIYLLTFDLLGILIHAILSFCTGFLWVYIKNTLKKHVHLIFYWKTITTRDEVCVK